MFKVTHEIITESDYLPVHFYTRFYGQFLVPTHWHEHIELLYLHSGEMSVIVKAHKYQLKPHDILIINSNELHMTQNEKSNVQFTLIQIPSKMLFQLIPNFQLIRFRTFISSDELGDSPDLLKVLYDLIDIFEKKEDGYPLLFTARLHELLFLLYKKYSYKLLSPNLREDHRNSFRIIQVIDWIQENYDQPLTLPMAAEYLGVSKEYFCRLFKSYTGQTFLEYLNIIRINNFYKELLTSDLSISLLMEQNGIKNYKTFIRDFKQIYGKTPQNLRMYVRKSPTDNLIPDVFS